MGQSSQHCSLIPLPALPCPLPILLFNVTTVQEREEVEGPFFLVERSSLPYYAMIILNRRSIDNFFQDIATDMTFEIQEKSAPLRPPTAPPRRRPPSAHAGHPSPRAVICSFKSRTTSSACGSTSKPRPCRQRTP